MTEHKKSSQHEKRRAERRPILDTFSVFVTIPNKGGYRLPLHNLSELGGYFDFDVEGEEIWGVPLKTGETRELHIYLNQSLYIPLKVKIVRVNEEGLVRKVGVEFVDRETKEYQALQSFLQMLDKVIEVGHINKAPDTRGY